MRFTLLAAALVAVTMTACGKPNQALPEQEKGNFAKIQAQQNAPKAPEAPEASAPASGTEPAAGSGTSSDAGDAAKK